MKHKIVVILSNRTKDKMMHACDVFESFKTLIEDPLLLDANFKDELTLTQIIAGLKEAYEKDGTHRVVAVFKPFVPEGSWIDQEIIMISTGQKFGKFYDMLAHLNYSGKLWPRRFLDEKVPVT